eukprot:TRINITY_DN435_c0_g1_i1.p1 TRINITY_DN435_c0_g1~~TRINITY_DN435_c0_g1_i1.p1  ORF type:complete len:876 (+),score=212.56 TRINITY_DN435_c0_g1_i1:26-2629(+)
MSQQAIEEQLDSFFSKIASGVPQALQEAERQANHWLQTMTADYLYCLARYTNNQQKPGNNRQRAATLLFGTLSAKDPTEKQFRYDRWLNKMPIEAKNQIKPLLLQTMTHNDADARRAATRAVAQIALIEIPQNQFVELVPMLIQNVLNTQKVPAEVREASLECLGMITEDIKAELLKDHADGILSAVIAGMRQEETNIMIKRKACSAMFSALEFCSKNFDHDNERSIIMNAVISCCKVDDEFIPISAYGILNEIAAVHYEKLPNHMQEVFAMTLNHIRGSNEAVAKQAVEFWCTLCDEEIALIDEVEYARSQNLPAPRRQPLLFVSGALQHLVQVLTEALTRTELDADPDDLTLAIAAGVCLSLVAQCVRDSILPHAVPFIEQHFMSGTWKFRNAAVITFGTILDGPRDLNKFITQATPALMDRHMKDEVVRVRDSACWALGRIVKMHHKSVLDLGEKILNAFAEALQGPPSVSSAACWGLHNLAASFESEEHNPFGKYFNNVVQALLTVGDRPDFDEFHLRVAAYETLNVVLASGPDSAANSYPGITDVLIKKLEASFSLQTLSKDDLMDQADLQSMLCGALQVICTKAGPGLAQFSDRMMICYLTLLSNPQSADVHEDAYLAISAVCDMVGADFEKYMKDFTPLLFQGLENVKAYEVCSIAVGCVGDVSRALGERVLPFCDQFVTALLHNLQNKFLDRSAKPGILSTFGDIAFAIRGNFLKYCESVLQMLRQASSTVMSKGSFDTDDWDMIDYMNDLQEGILEAYIGILQGLNASGKADALYAHVNTIMQLIAHVASNSKRSQGCAFTAVGLVSDLVVVLNDKVKGAVTQQFVINLVRETRQSYGDDKEVVDATNFCMEAIKSIS